MSGTGSSLLVNVGDLRRRLGTRARMERSAVLDELELTGATVPAGSAVELDLTLESIFDGVVATGTLRAPWEGDCRRCLQPVRGEIRPDFREVFEVQPTEGETFPLTGDQLDLEPLVREVVLLSLPLAPLCDEACTGPAPESFPTAIEGGAEPDPDPRWAVLDELRFDR
ncbi:YceD family protein [soil metagenome]